MATVILLAVSLLVPGVQAAQKSIVCPRAGKKVKSKKVDGFDPVRRFNEISGLVLSPNQVNPDTGNPVMYVVNDGHEDNLSGIWGRMGVYDSGTGDRLATLEIQKESSSMKSHDWESLSIGVCSKWDDSTCIYIADVGDNVARNTQGQRSGRSENRPYKILKIKEPSISDLPSTDDPDRKTLKTDLLDALEFDYRHSDSPTKYADSEAIFFDHVGWGGSVGDIYLVTKWNKEVPELTRLYRFPVEAWDANFLNTYSPRPVGGFKKGHRLRQGTWTGAESTADGTVIAISSHFETYLFLRCPGATVAEALMGDSCYQFDHPYYGQVETTALSLDGKKLFEIPEGNSPAIAWTELIYSNNAGIMASLFGGVASTSQVCPDLEWVVYPEVQCRTRIDKVEKPFRWCKHSPNDVPTVLTGGDLDAVIVERTVPKDTTTKSKPSTPAQASAKPPLEVTEAYDKSSTSNITEPVDGLEEEMLLLNEEPTEEEEVIGVFDILSDAPCWPSLLPFLSSLVASLLLGLH